MAFRKEKDILGEKNVPRDAYWGIHTQRAKENFALTGLPVNRMLIRSMAMVKKACSLANRELGYLPQDKADAIGSACDEIISGKMSSEFPVDALQGGAGTSTNMNLNEVIANRACELLRGEKGDHRLVHPLEHVNLHQSTNDVYPTALKVACIFRLRELSSLIALTQGAFQRKEKEFSGVVKLGRTEMEEAVPITLGLEFSAFAEALARDRWRTFKSEERLRVVNLGGTAVGTGLGAPRSFIFLVIEKLREITGLGLARAENVVDPTANNDAFVEVSGILKAHASNLIKIAQDLRLLRLLKEIDLPALQAGSSIMPGKVNPVILEAVIQAGLKAVSDDLLVTEAVSRSTLQISEFMPLLSYAMLDALDILANANIILEKHVAAITANAQVCRENLEKSPVIVTAFIPYIGYDKALGLLQDFKSSGRADLRGFLEERLGKEMVDKALDPYNLTSLGFKDEKNP